MPSYKKILITGDSGRGKSTFAKKLSDALDIPTYETDDYYWKTKFSEPANKQASIDKISQIYTQDTWIVDGSTRHLIQGAIEKADIIYILEFKSIIPQYYHLIKRSFGRKHERWRDTWSLLVHVTRKRYKKGYRSHLPPLNQILKPYEDKVVRLSSLEEIRSEFDKYTS